METFEAECLDKTPCGSEVVTCRFSRPPGYDFAAGQFMMLGLETGAGREQKPFTIASAPEDDWLEITTRMSGSTFKAALAEMGPGTAVTVSRAAGRLALPDEGRVRFLVGGVGITPAHSMLRHSVMIGRRLDAVLFFGNRDATCMPYAEEFDAMESIGVRTVHVLQFPPVDWQGESGFITADLVRASGATDLDAVWIVAGPPAMVEAMAALLDELTVPDQNRRIERFTGYA